MKCPKCGAYNKPEYKKCYVCNTMLPQEYIEEKHKENKNNMWTQGAFREGVNKDTAKKDNQKSKEQDNKNSFYDINNMEQEFSSEEKKVYSIYAKRAEAKDRGVWGNEKSSRFTRRGEGNIPVVALEDESQVKTTKKRKRGSKYKVEQPSKNSTRIKNFREGQEIGIVIPPEPEKPKKKKEDYLPKKTTYKKKLNIKWGRLILVSMLTVCVLFGVIVGIVALTNKVSESMSQIFVPRNQLPNNGQPLVERILKDGQEWHTITFYGEDGDKILVEDESHNIKRTLTIHNNQALLSLDDYSYIPIDGEEYYGEEFTYVDIKAWHFDKDGIETELEVPEYRISVPLAPLNVIHPVEQGETFDTTQVLIKVKVEPNSRVLIGDKNMSGNIDADGYTSTYIYFDEPGMNAIDIKVEVDGYRVNDYEVLVNNPEKDVDIRLTDAPTETQASELVINGVTEPGSTVVLDSSMPLLIDFIDVKSDGKFYLKTKLSDFGENEVKLYVTAADGRIATLKHIIHRIPLEGAYTSSAWKLDYKALTSSANKIVGNVYHLQGYVVERIDTSEAKYFLFNAGTAAEPRNLIIEYNGLYDIKQDGTVYDVYADVEGKYENYPQLHARFIYVSEDQNQNGIDDEVEGYVRDTSEDNN